MTLAIITEVISIPGIIKDLGTAIIQEKDILLHILMEEEPQLTKKPNIYATATFLDIINL